MTDRFAPQFATRVREGASSATMRKLRRFQDIAEAREAAHAVAADLDLRMAAHAVAAAELRAHKANGGNWRSFAWTRRTPSWSATR